MEHNLSKKYIIQQFLHYLFPFKFILILSFLLIILSNILALIGPYLCGLALDGIANVSTGGSFTVVTNLCLIMILCYICSAFLTYITSYLMIRIGKHISQELRKDVQNHLLHLPVSYFDTKQAGDIISCVSYDIGLLNTSITNDIMSIGNSLVTLVFSLVMMLTISPPLVLIFVIMIPTMAAFAKYRLKKTKPLFRLRSKKLGELNGFAEETLSGTKTIIAYHKQNVMRKRFNERNEATSAAYYNADLQGSIMAPFAGLIGNITLSIVGLLGSILFMIGRITIGNLSSFILYSRKFIGPINEIANISSELQSALSAANRIFTLLAEEPEAADDKDALVLSNPVGNVRFQDVSFGYTPDKVILKHISLDVPSGKTVAIVGSTGSGKTTIVNLLMRFYDYNSGEITIDGIPITAVTRTSLRQSFSMVLQDTWIFQGTIFENIAYAKKDATLEEVKRVAKAAKADHFIHTLPDGYDTYITDDGSNLSKGQKQLLTIARAMLVDASMLILDEATSNIDSGTERLVQEAMAKLMEDKTCFVIAHRLSTIRNADQIIVMGDGEILETGTHSELLNKNGAYNRMYQSQFS